MQCLPLSESLSSTTFQFLVGLERKAFNVHSSLAVKLSPVFAALINGNMAESVERRAVLDDIDEKTFLRFCEFAYKGDFSVPPPETVADRELLSPLQSGTSCDNLGSSHSKSFSTGVEKVSDSSAGEGPTTPTDGLRQALHHNHHKRAWTHQISRPISWLRWCRIHQNSKVHSTDTQAKAPVISYHPDPGSKLAMDWTKFRSAASDWNGPIFHPYRNSTPSESLMETLLSLAKLYVFADRYVIESLRSLVLYKMRRTLVSLKLFPQRVSEVFLLVQYVYDHTREGDDLRLLLTQFAACMINVFLQHSDWDRFICEQQTFTSELLHHLRDSVKEIDDHGRRRAAY
ncbi:BTB/POZ domain-containing protein [Cladophialophora immunda]|nr:BTB/POZ domain-containing protein [Cladophialophora immunda]